MKSVGNLNVIFLLAFLFGVNCLDLQKLSDDCLKGKPAPGGLECTTAKGVQIQRIHEGFQKFYCINYEKKTGNINEFDTLTFDLSHDDYDLKFVSKS